MSVSVRVVRTVRVSVLLCVDQPHALPPSVCVSVSVRIGNALTHTLRTASLTALSAKAANTLTNTLALAGEWPADSLPNVCQYATLYAYNATAREPPMTASTATQTGTRTVGAMVTYHGSITTEHWAPFYIAAVAADGRLTLIDRDYPNVTTLRQVRPNSVTPTGETIQMCACGHEAGAARHNWSGHCELRSCTCWNHTEERTS